VRNEIDVDLDDNTISDEQHTVQLRPDEAELAFALHRELPQFASMIKIKKALWGALTPPVSANGTIYNLVSKLRKSIAALGLTVEKQPKADGDGYRLGRAS
jgi:DNA-binding response OmpR family regulator